MANFELKFIDALEASDYIKVNAFKTTTSKHLISIEGKCAGCLFDIMIDKSTAIKFAKTLRTEINKIQE